MPQLEILLYPDPLLSKLSRPVNRFGASLRRFVDALEETLDQGPGGVGIAAPQVGRLERIMLVDASNKPKYRSHGRLVLINPQILNRRGAVVVRERCLSIPDETVEVRRAKKITVVAQDARGVQRRYICVGYEAYAIQHEVDHLDGLLLTDRVKTARRIPLHRRRRSWSGPHRETA